MRRTTSRNENEINNWSKVNSAIEFETSQERYTTSGVHFFKRGFSAAPPASQKVILKTKPLPEDRKANTFRQKLLLQLNKKMLCQGTLSKRAYVQNEMIKNT